ncbi:MAG: hypothetical protein ACLFWI_14140 [Coleofasciculus sp.]
METKTADGSEIETGVALPIGSNRISWKHLENLLPKLFQVLDPTDWVKSD